MKNSTYKKIANKVIELEIDALKKLKKSINKSFDKAVNAIVKCQSKIILCGVGKSYLIASKIAATLSSVGCPSFLSQQMIVPMEILEAYQKDLLIVISNSGNTQN